MNNHHSKCTSHPNIALIKYWGKDDEQLNTPIHGSFSVTLDFGTTETDAKFSDNDKFFLNEKADVITPRLQNALTFFRSKAENTNTCFSIKSTNNFPTAAGMASSASGAAAFVGALASLVGDTESPIEFWNERNVDLSRIARQVSGSGCRSIYGGFVEWKPGDNKHSIATQVFNESHWKDFVALSISLHTKPKKVSSTAGMQQTVKTCPWMHWRGNEVVPKRIKDAKMFIANKDFQSLSEIIMKESNELHANCAATYPPIHYLNDSSYQVINAIHELNASKGKNFAAYSFDAGPNPFIFTELSHLPEVLSCIKSIEDIDIENNIIEAHPSKGIVSKII